MPSRDLSKLSEDELVAENQRLMAEKDAVRAQQEAVRDELNARHAQREAEKLLDGLSPEQAKVVQAVAASASAAPTEAGG